MSVCLISRSRAAAIGIGYDHMQPPADNRKDTDVDHTTLDLGRSRAVRS